MRQSKITQGHARALLPLGDEREQVAFCNRIQQEGLSVRDTESLVQDSITQADAEPLAVVGRDGSVSKPKRKQSGQLAALEQEFRARLGMGEDHPQCQRPRQAGDPVQQPRRVRASP